MFMPNGTLRLLSAEMSAVLAWVLDVPLCEECLL